MGFVAGWRNINSTYIQCLLDIDVYYIKCVNNKQYRVDNHLSDAHEFYGFTLQQLNVRFELEVTTS